MLSMCLRSGPCFANIARRSMHVSRALISAAPATQSALQQQAHRLALQELREHYERIAATTRPISPHLMVYKMESHMFMSLMNRATGSYLACVAIAFGGMSLVGGMFLPGWYTWCMNFLAGIHPIFTYFIKFCLTLPFGIHLGNGLRHFAHDFGYMLGRTTITATQLGTLAFALAVGCGLALYTVKP